MQWAEGGSLDDFIDVRLGRKPAHAPIYHSDSEIVNPFSTSRSVSRIPSAQIDVQEGDNENGNVNENLSPTQSNVAAASTARWESISHHAKQPSFNSKELHSRSAKLRAFRAYQRAPLEEKERMRREMQDVFQGFPGVDVLTTGGSVAADLKKNEWTAVHLLSADEVKNLFRDVVEGLGFLVGIFSFFC